jgi:hypothetical protein
MACQQLDRGLRPLYQVALATLRRAGYGGPGQETLRLSRGVVHRRAEVVFEVGKEYTLQHNAVSSWTTERAVAERFAKTAGAGAQGYVVEVQGRPEDVLATTPVLAAFLSQTALGPFEGVREMVVFGGPGLTGRVMAVFPGHAGPRQAVEANMLPVEGPENTYWLRLVS